MYAKLIFSYSFIFTSILDYLHLYFGWICRSWTELLIQRWSVSNWLEDACLIYIGSVKLNTNGAIDEIFHRKSNYVQVGFSGTAQDISLTIQVFVQFLELNYEAYLLVHTSHGRKTSGLLWWIQILQLQDYISFKVLKPVIILISKSSTLSKNSLHDHDRFKFIMFIGRLVAVRIGWKIMLSLLSQVFTLLLLAFLGVFIALLKHMYGTVFLKIMFFVILLFQALSHPFNPKIKSRTKKIQVVHIFNFADLILCTEKQLSPNCFRKKKPEFICLVTPSAQLLAQLTKAGLPYCLHLLDFLPNTLLPDSPRNKKRLTGKMVTNFHPLDHTVHYQTTPQSKITALDEPHEHSLEQKTCALLRFFFINRHVAVLFSTLA